MMSYLGSARFEKILDKDKFERDLVCNYAFAISCHN